MLEGLRPEFWLQLIAYVAMLVVAYFGLRQTVAVLSSRLGSLETQMTVQNTKIDKLEGLFIQSARYEERQANADQHILLLRKEIDELKHGQGYVNGPRLANAAVP